MKAGQPNFIERYFEELLALAKESKIELTTEQAKAFLLSSIRQKENSPTTNWTTFPAAAAAKAK